MAVPFDTPQNLRGNYVNFDMPTGFFQAIGLYDPQNIVNASVALGVPAFVNNPRQPTALTPDEIAGVGPIETSYVRATLDYDGPIG
jgi:hypothetical protein